MTGADLQQSLDLCRRKTLEMLDVIAARSDAAAILGWRPGPGRAHIAWQLMHIAATDDRHLYARMKGGDPKEPELVRRFAGGSTPDEAVPTPAEIRRYLTDRRGEMLSHLAALTDAAVLMKPNDKAPWTYREWVQVLAWHEAHHQGQAHLTFNMYKAAHDPVPPKT